MIKSKQDLYTYLNCDKIVYGGKACKIPSNKLQHRLWITKQILKDIRCDYKVFNFIFLLECMNITLTKVTNPILIELH